MLCATPSTRRGFTISPIVMLLFIILLALAAVYGWLMYSRLSAAPPGGITASGVMISVVLGVVIGMVIYLVILSVITAVVYFASGRNETAANFTIGLLLLLGVTGFSINSYSLANAPPLPKPVTLADQTKARSDQLQQDMQAQRDAMQRQTDAAREAMNRASEANRQAMERSNQNARDAEQRLRDAMRNPANGGRPTPSAPPTPGAAQPQGTPPTNPRPAPPSSTPASNPVDPAVKQALDALSTEVTAQIDDLAGKLSPLLASLSKPPKQDIREIRKRIEDIAALREPTAELGKRLRDLSSEAEKKLAAANLSTFPAHAFASDYRAMPRAFAAESILRLLDSANEESTFLRDNIGKWTIGRDGKVDSKDFSIKSKANSTRFMLEATLGRKDQLLDDLKGR